MRDLKNYEGLYFADENGNIFSYPKKTRNGIRQIKPNKLKLGYLFIDLCKDGFVKKHLVHRLIADTFIENPENKPQVNHIDGNKVNNHVSNLEWCTASENQKHAIKNNLRSAKGEKNSQSKLTLKQVSEIFSDNRLYKEISLDYNISMSTISSIKNKKTWV